MDDHEISMQDALSIGPLEAKIQLKKIRSNPNHPYNRDGLPSDEHNEAVEVVNRLYEVIAKNQPMTLADIPGKVEAERIQRGREQYGDAHFGEGLQARSSGNNVRRTEYNLETTKPVEPTPIKGQIVKEGEPRGFIDSVSRMWGK